MSSLWHTQLRPPVPVPPGGGSRPTYSIQVLRYYSLDFITVLASASSGRADVSSRDVAGYSCATILDIA